MPTYKKDLLTFLWESFLPFVLIEFHPSALEIAVLLYGYNFWNGIACLIYGALANQYGYDKMLVLLLSLQCISIGLEALAPSFYVLFNMYIE